MLWPCRAEALDEHAPFKWLTVSVSAKPQAADAVRQACPGIDPAVLSLGIASVLPSDWDQKTRATGCRDLDALAQRYASQPSSTLPAIPDLRAIALRLEQPQAPYLSSGLWDHVKTWLRRRLAPLEGLLKWFRRLPGGNAGPAFRTLLLVVAGALILLGIAAVILNELRAAGVFDSGSRRRRAVQTRAVMADPSAAADIDATHALDSPASALRMLIEALRHSRRIEQDGNLTCREMLARAMFDTQGQREEFASIALLAERELFGLRGLPMRVPDELRPILQALYTQLSAAPAVRSAAS
jgi:hypothetical protein